MVRLLSDIGRPPSTRATEFKNAMPPFARRSDRNTRVCGESANRVMPSATATAKFAKKSIRQFLLRQHARCDDDSTERPQYQLNEPSRRVRPRLTDRSSFSICLWKTISCKRGAPANWPPHLVAHRSPRPNPAQHLQ